MPIDRDFASGRTRVLAIGGCPFSGKSALARQLSHALGVDFISTDDLAAAARAVTTAASHPSLHRSAGFDYREYYVENTPDELWHHAAEEHAALRPAIMAVIEAHATWGTHAIVEGWALR